MVINEAALSRASKYSWYKTSEETVFNPERWLYASTKDGKIVAEIHVYGIEHFAYWIAGNLIDSQTFKLVFMGKYISLDHAKKKIEENIGG